MPQEPDTLLLSRYAKNREEPAFAEFVRRRLNGVYAFALRRLAGDAHLAQDVAQQVFVAAARQAGALSRHPDLTGWLYTTTRHQAANAVRGERRRRVREERALVMPENSPPPDIDWNQAGPVLDDAIDQLGAEDRAAILLRFVERRAFAEVGAALNVSEDAARMRVDRALEKLRAWLEQRGIASSSAALGAALASQPAQAAPAGLAASVLATALAAGTNAGTGGAIAGLLIMSKLKIGTAAAIAVIASLAFKEVRAGRALDAEIRQMQTAQAEIGALRKANASLLGKLGQVDATLPAMDELQRLRQGIARLKARPDGVVESAMKPVGAYVNRGWATPVAAFETQLWARVAGDMDEFAHAFGWTADGKVKIDRFFAALPDQIRARHGTPERMLAPDAAKWGSAGDPVAVQILGQSDFGDKTIVHAWGRLSSGREVNMDMAFQRTAEGWRVPLTDEMTDRTIASRDPATGELRPKP